jgi:hypothetical protein
MDAEYPRWFPYRQTRVRRVTDNVCRQLLGGSSPSVCNSDEEEKQHAAASAQFRSYKAKDVHADFMYLCRQHKERRGRKTCNNTMQGALSTGRTCCLFQMAEILKLTVTKYVLSLEVVLWNIHSEFGKHNTKSLLFTCYFLTHR